MTLLGIVSIILLFTAAFARPHGKHFQNAHSTCEKAGMASRSDHREQLNSHALFFAYKITSTHGNNDAGYDQDPCNGNTTTTNPSEYDHNSYFTESNAVEADFGIVKRADDEITYPAEATKRQDLNCGQCNGIYSTCMNACMKANPNGLGRWGYCHDACFCEVGKFANCGWSCGFDEIPCKDDGSTNLESDVLAVMAIEMAPSRGKVQRDADRIVHQSPVTAMVKELQTTAIPTLIERQTFDQCAGCGQHIRLCMNSRCPTNEKAAAIDCVCNQKLSSCTDECWRGRCSEGAGTNWDNYCPAVLASLSPGVSKIKVSETLIDRDLHVETTKGCAGCPAFIADCGADYCSGLNQGEAVNCVCDKPTAECPRTCLGEGCREKIPAVFEWLCSLIAPPLPSIPEVTTQGSSGFQ